MGSKKRSTKMSLTEFLADQSTGSWADEMEDLPSAPAAAFSDYGDHEDRQKSGFGDRRSGFSDRRTYSRDSRYESRESPRESRFSSRPERIPQELPTSPPYTAHIGNLPYDLTEGQVKRFFNESKILNIRILRDKENDKPKGFGYVEFEDLESLTKALQLSGENLGNRPVKISVADPPREREDRTAGEWRRKMPRETQAPSPRSDRFGSNDKFGHREDKWGERGGGFRDRVDRFDRGERDRGDRFDRMDRSIERNDRGGNDKLERKGDTEWRGGGFNNSRSSSFRERRSEERYATDTDTSPPMRKKLELKPRSSAAVSNENIAPRSSKPNPFGEARPIDTDEALRRVEERRKQKEQEQKEKEETGKTTEFKNGNDTTITTENGNA
ncbi:RNA-binding domain-containing protein [Rhizophagus clarus]|uniref:RNA-binding domain-containing protein n=1 Tax=Rhizophagus clarus TaxID=94130 RepID=A0A8H3LAN5_9GLOM|nr:RNA-binding domain-containing protein [Rhizophagus clarus]